MDDIIQDSANKIKKMYRNLTYFDEYGNSVILFIVLLTILFLVHSYCSIMVNIQPIKDNWLEYRCKPNIIPFAGLINKPPDQTATEFAQNNFTGCVQNMVVPITVNAVNPFSLLTKALLSIYTIIADAIQKIRDMFNAMRNSISDVLKDIMGRILNFLIPVQQLVLNAKDLMGKVSGVMQDALYTSTATYYMLKSFLGTVVTGSIRTLLIGVGVMIAMYVVLVVLSIVFFPAAMVFLAGAIVPYQILYIVVVGILLYIIIFLETVVGVHPDGVIPGLPDTPPLGGSCFGNDTLLVLKDGTKQYISEIKVGDVLKGSKEDSIVTATMKLDATNIDMYWLYGIAVSGIHRINYLNKWICVKDHPFAMLMDNYTDPFIYCLNTNTKRIEIRGIVFIDWDEIFRESTVDVHKYYDGGLDPATPIILQSGKEVQIADVVVGDVLQNGAIVYGTVIIDGSTIDKQYIYDHGFRGKIITNNVSEKMVLSKKINRLYHLLTDKKEFYVKYLQVYDYNYYIDSIAS